MGERRIEIQSGELQLEGMLRDGDGDLAALVLHPHPKYGGDMDNHVVTAVCETLAGAGASTLRFNFRGAGRSQGEFHGHGGENDDARAALTSLREAAPGKPVLVAGYSFGAAVAASIAAEPDISALVLISLPAGMMQTPALPAGLKTLLVTGERDNIAPPEGLRGMASDERVLVVVPGADHGWWPGVDTLRDAVAGFVRATLS